MWSIVISKKANGLLSCCSLHVVKEIKANPDAPESLVWRRSEPDPSSNTKFPCHDLEQVERELAELRERLQHIDIGAQPHAAYPLHKQEDWVEKSGNCLVCVNMVNGLQNVWLISATVGSQVYCSHDTLAEVQPGGRQ